MYVQHDVQGVVVEAQRAPSWQVWSGKKLCGGQVPYAKLLHASTYMGKANDVLPADVAPPPIRLAHQARSLPRSLPFLRLSESLRLLFLPSRTPQLPQI